MNMKKFAASFLALTMASSMLTGCSGGGASSSASGTSASGTTGDTIKIGAIGPMTGGAADYGISASNGLKLAVNEVNAAGGILGKQVEIIVQDDEHDATKSVNAYNKLVGEGVVGIWGPVTSNPSISVAQKANKDGMPMVSPTATAEPVTKGFTSVFRACFLDPTQGEAVADYASAKLNMKNVAVLYDITDNYSIGVAEAFKKKAEACGMTVSAYESFSATDTDFKSQLSKIKSTGAEGLFVPSYYNTNALIAIQAKELGLTCRLMGADGWDGVLSVLEGNNASAADGTIFSSHYFGGDTDPLVKSFVENYKKAYNTEPNSFAALGYDAGKILMEAIANAGSTDKAAVTKALAATDFTGVTGPLHYDGSGDPVKTISLLTVENGSYSLVEKYSLTK